MSNADLRNVIASEKIQNYLLHLAKIEGNDMVNLAALGIIQEYMKQEDEDTIKIMFLQKGLLDSLLIAFDTGMEDRINLGLIDVSLKSLWLLSQLSIGPLQPLISDNVIRRLLTVMDVDGNFFRYSSDLMEQEFKKMCGNKNLVGKVDAQQMSIELIRQIYKLSNGKLGKLTKLPSCLNVCTLYDTNEDDTDVDIAQCLIGKKLAWSSGNHTNQDGNHTNQDGIWEDIAVTQIIDGPIFWAHIGISKMETVRLIQTFLQTSVEDLVPGDIKLDGEVVVCSEFDGVTLFMRAQILSEEDSVIKVWALDYGFIIDVRANQIFTVPNEVCLDKHPPLASLCCLAGIQAPPKCATMVEVVAAILCNLSKKSFPAGEIINKFGGLEIVEKLLKTCTNDVVNLQAIQLVNNLSCNIKLSSHIAKSGLVKVLLGKCKQYMVSSDECQGDELFATSLTCLCNLIFQNEENRSKFYHHQGIEMTLKTMMMSNIRSTSYKLACRLLKIFVWKIDLPLASKTQKSDMFSKNKEITKSKTLQKAFQRLPVEAAKLITDEDLGEKPHLPCKPKGFQKTLHESRLVQDSSSDEEDEHYRHRNVVSGDDTDSELLLHSHHGLGDTGKMSTNSRQQSLPERYYILDSNVDIGNDSMHEFRPNKTLANVSATKISPHICGMLNTGQGGTIFFGITSNRQVQGVKLTRDEKDAFRIGVDKMMVNRISPCLVHSLFDIFCVPVAEVDTETRTVQIIPDLYVLELDTESRRVKIIPDLYVIEIVLRPNKGTLYITTGEKICYYRYGPNTSPLSIMELRELIILEEEEEYRDQIIQLKLELQELKNS